MTTEDGVTFAHALLFECSRCGRPIAMAMLSTHRNLEEVHGNEVELRCECGWSELRLGVQARRHWVEPWPQLAQEHRSQSDTLASNS